MNSWKHLDRLKTNAQIAKEVKLHKFFQITGIQEKLDRTRKQNASK